MFIPGETITHAFVIPFAVDELNAQHAVIYVTYKQKDHVVLEKRITGGWETEDVSYSRIEVNLEQSESLLFNNKEDLYIQLNVLIGSTRMASKLIKASNGIQLKREEIKSEVTPNG